MNKKGYCLIVFLIAFCQGGWSQVPIDTVTTVTTVDTATVPDTAQQKYLIADTVAISDSADTVVERSYQTVKRQIIFMKEMGPPDTVYSVQITLGEDSVQVEEARQKFLNHYPHRSTHIYFNKPYYKLRTGQYLKRDQAKQARSALQGKYPECFIVEELTDKPSRNGEVRIQQDDRIDKLVDKHKWRNKNHSTITRYRIQLYASSEREEVMDKKAKFVEEYPETPYFLRYNQPYFKLRVGNYITIWKAKKAKVMFARKFNNAFIVEEKIDYSELQEEK